MSENLVISSGDKDKKSNDLLSTKFPKLGNIPFFVLGLTSEKKRNKNLKKRLKYHKLEDQTTFVPGVSGISAEVKSVLFNSKNERTYANCSPNEAACKIGHLRCLFKFLRSGSLYGFVGENDMVPLNDFREKFDTIFSEVPSETPLIMLSVYNSAFHGIKDVGTHFRTIGEFSFSTLGYLISRKYAEEILNTFCKYIPNEDNLDRIKYRPFAEIPAAKCLRLNPNLPESESNKRITAEIITIKSGGLFTKLPLLVDESLDTSIQQPISNEWHLKYYAQFDHKNYAAADIDAGNEELLKLWKIPYQKPEPKLKVKKVTVTTTSTATPESSK